jgi:hypothetical protein
MTNIELLQRTILATVYLICAMHWKSLSASRPSVVAYATRLHIDTPRRHPFLPYQGFWENKWVVDVPLQGIHDLDQMALGRGGAGHGRFTFAILDHSYNLCNAYGWGDRNERGNGVLF